MAHPNNTGSGYSTTSTFADGTPSTIPIPRMPLSSFARSSIRKDKISEEQVRAALDEFPHESQDKALLLYVEKYELKGIFFIDKYGNQCIWEDFIRFRRNRAPTQKVSGPGNRTFFLKTKEENIKIVDKPQPAWVREATAHIREKGWNLPRDHPRHLLNFPTEIKLMILRLIVKLPDEISSKRFLIPNCFVSNWKAGLSIPGWNISHMARKSPPQSLASFYAGIHDMLDTYSVHISRTYGPTRQHKARRVQPYIRLRKYIRSALDASFLRVSKELRTIGSDILYGSNKYMFDMTNPYRGSNPPLLCGKYEVIRPDPELDDKRKHDMHYPHPAKFPLSDAQQEETIECIQKQAPLRDLPGYVYYDPFLRFLHTIGPDSASRLKNLSFRGTCLRHECLDDCPHSRPCDDGIFESLRIYIPVITRVCTGLEHLSIYIWQDRHDTGKNQEPSQPDLQDTLVPFLHAEIPKIDSLKVFKVYYLKTEQNSDINIEDTLLELAMPTMDFVHERASEREQARVEAVEAARKESSRLAKIKSFKCDFCGEDRHVWANCYNLCGCERFGHVKERCDP